MNEFQYLRSFSLRSFSTIYGTAVITDKKTDPNIAKPIIYRLSVDVCINTANIKNENNQAIRNNINLFNNT